MGKQCSLMRFTGTRLDRFQFLLTRHGTVFNPAISNKYFS